MDIYITITGYKHYFGIGIFNIGDTFLIKPEPENPHDKYAVAVYSEKYGKCGYIADTKVTAVQGTEPAKSLYDLDIDGAKIKIRFIAGEYIIASLEKPANIIY
ncbi:MAG: HIRAN domain-containing protein [Clostridia bacterium]|nr:HIRAN domain-containing protein [Clostridia bacterium]